MIVFGARRAMAYDERDCVGDEGTKNGMAGVERKVS